MYLCINIYSYIDRQTDRQLDRQIFIYVLSRSKVYDPPLPPLPSLQSARRVTGGLAGKGL